MHYFIPCVIVIGTDEIAKTHASLCMIVLFHVSFIYNSAICFYLDCVLTIKCYVCLSTCLSVQIDNSDLQQPKRFFFIQYERIIFLQVFKLAD